MDLSITVNGKTTQIADLMPQTSLLNWLRQSGLTGCKEGCAEGECGACAVLIARPDEQDGTRLDSINACLMSLPAVNGCEIITSEGLGTPSHLHPVQQEMALRGGSQCGYCTAGFVCSMAAEYYRSDRHILGQPDPVSGQVSDQSLDEASHHAPNGFDIHALSGNLCRCTGYRPIQDAAYALAAPAATDPLAQRLKVPSLLPSPTQLATEDGDFYRPAQLSEVLSLLRQHPKAKILAGGTDWGVEVNIRHARTPVTIAVDALPELRGLEWHTDHVLLGAGLSLSDLERRLAGTIPLLAQWFPQFASRLIRNSATLGGNIGTASPIGDSPPVLLALNASLVLVSVQGDREVPLSEFFTGYRQTLLQPAELIRAIKIPLPLAPHTAFYKIAKRRFDDISSVAVGIALEFEAGSEVQPQIVKTQTVKTQTVKTQIVKTIRIGLGGVAATSLRAYAAEEALNGKPFNEENIRRAAKNLGRNWNPSK